MACHNGIYNINKHAKKYARLADENYREGKGAAAKTNSLKKKALYRLKTRAINKLLKRDLADRAECHKIDGEKYICVWFGNWSFHQPKRIKAVHTKWFPDMDPDEIREIEDFDSIEEKGRSNMSLKAALLHIEAELGLNGNEYFDLGHTQSHVQYGHRQHFAGWSYLGDGGERTTVTTLLEGEE